MTQPVVYDYISVKDLKKCLKLFYMLKYENRKLKLKDISIFSSEYGSFQYLVHLNNVFSTKKMKLDADISLQLNWLLDKYYKFSFPDDRSSSGLRIYFEDKTDDISYLLDEHEFDNLLDKELQRFIKACENYIIRSQKYNRYEPTKVVNFVTSENCNNKNILNLVRTYLIEILDLHLSYLLINIKYDADVLYDIYPKKVTVLKSFRFRKSEVVLRQLYDILRTKYIEEVEFDIFEKHFSDSVIVESEQLIWKKSTVLLAFFIKHLQDEDYLSVSENMWQKTELCFKDRNANILASSHSRSAFPKGYSELTTILSNVK